MSEKTRLIEITVPHVLGTALKIESLGTGQTPEELLAQRLEGPIVSGELYATVKAKVQAKKRKWNAQLQKDKKIREARKRRKKHKKGG